MLTKSVRAAWLADGSAGPQSRQERQSARARVASMARRYSNGDTDALDWRADPRLRAILSRAANASKRIAKKTTPFRAVTDSATQRGKTRRRPDWSAPGDC